MAEEVIGIDDVRRMLQAAPRLIVARAFLRALSAGANVIADELEARTPVKAEDTGGVLDKGVLRESVMIAIEIDSDLRGGRAEVGFGKNGFVANWLEYGHRMMEHGKKIPRANRKLIGSGFVPARPFMRPAAAASADRAIEAFSEALVEELQGKLLDGA